MSKMIGVDCPYCGKTLFIKTEFINNPLLESVKYLHPDRAQYDRLGREVCLNCNRRVLVTVSVLAGEGKQ